MHGMECFGNSIPFHESSDRRKNKFTTGNNRVFFRVLKSWIAPLKTRLSNGHLTNDLPHWPYAYTYGGRRLHELFLTGKTSLQRVTVWLPKSGVASTPCCNLQLQPVAITEGKITILTFQVIRFSTTWGCTRQQHRQWIWLLNLSFPLGARYEMQQLLGRRGAAEQINYFSRLSRLPHRKPHGSSIVCRCRGTLTVGAEQTSVNGKQNASLWRAESVL